MAPKRPIRKNQLNKPRLSIEGRFRELDTGFLKHHSFAARASAKRLLEESLRSANKRASPEKVSSAISYLKAYVRAGLKLNQAKKNFLKKMKESGHPVPRLHEQMVVQVEKNLKQIEQLIEAAERN